MSEVQIDYAALTGHCGALSTSTSSFDEIVGAAQTASITSNLAFGILCSPFFLPIAATAQGAMLTGLTAARTALDKLNTDVAGCRDDSRRTDDEAAEKLRRILTELDSRAPYTAPGGGAL